MFDSDDIEILHETKDMIVELNACVATWATMCGNPKDSSSLVAFLNELLKTKQDLFYYIVETETERNHISPLKEGVVAFVTEENKLYVYSATAGWIDLTPDLSDFYTKSETDALLALKANIDDFYSKIEADERFATITALDEHINNHSNPHQVTKSQVGLNKVENLAPLEMPISTATQNALDLKQNTITGAVSNVVDTNLPTGKLVVTNNAGKLSTTDMIDLSQLSLLDGLEGNIQDQLDGKEDKFAKNTAFNKNFTLNLANIKMDGVASLGISNELPRADHVHPSDTTKLDKNPEIEPATATKITYDEKGLVVGGSYLTISDIPDLSSLYEKSNFKVNILTDSTYQYPTTHAVTTALAPKANKDYVDDLYQTLTDEINDKETAFTKNTAFNKNFATDKQEMQMDGEASVGTSLNVPRADHVHPTDTTREAVANKTDYYSDASPITYPSSRALYNGLRTRLKPSNVIPGDNITVVVDGERIIISSYGSKSATWGHIIGNLSDQTDLINYIDTGIATSSATFRGTFNSVADLEAYSGEKDNNDYAFVISTDSAGNTVYDRYKYDGTQWLYEYSLNNSSFDAEQWAAINSKATAEKISSIANKIELTSLSSSATGLSYDNTTGVFSLTSGYVIPEQTTLNNLQRNFTFTEKGITHTTSSYSTIDLAKEIAALNLDMGITLFGEVRLNDMPTGIGNAEMKVEVQQKTGSTSVLAFTLTSTNVAPHEWTFYWVGNGTSGNPSTTEWYATVREDMVLTRTNTSSYTPTGDYNPATKKYVDDTTAGIIPTQSGNSGKFLTTNGTVISWATVDALPNQSGQSGKFLTTDGSTASWATVDALPSQTSQSGKFLTTNGTTASWADIPTEIPSQSGQSGKFLTTDGSDVSWANVDALPAQSGQSGKFLTTDGTDASWSDVPEEIPSQTGHSGEFLTTNGSTVSWASVDALPSQTGQSGKFLTTDGSSASWASALTSSDVVNNVLSTSTDTPLSANMGKELQDQITHLQGIGRFLALWDCSTGLAETNPPTQSYNYKTGDYFIVGTVATGSGTNYKPNGSQYVIGTASTTVETETVKVGYVYYYDGTTWKLQPNEAGTVTDVQVSGTSIVTSGVASIPYGTNAVAGLAKAGSGLASMANGTFYIYPATDAAIGAKTNTANPIVPSNLNKAVMEGLGNYSGTAWTDAYKANARNTIGATQAVFVDWSD